MDELKDIYDEYDPADEWVLHGDRAVERENDRLWKKFPEKFNDSSYDNWKTQNPEWR